MQTLKERGEVLQDHVAHAHHQSPFQTYFKEVIFGGIDGIITTFAVVAGFSGAALSGDATTQLSFLVMLLFGLANLFADGVSMGLGNILSVRSDKDLYNAARRKETDEVRTHAENEVEETVTLLMQKGYSMEDARTMTVLYQKNEVFWVDFMMTNELQMSDPRGDNPWLTGLATFVSFVVFGFIPLAPFVFAGTAAAGHVFVYSIMGTALALFLLGILKWKIVGTPFVKTMLEVLVIGVVAATVAFFVGSLFEI
jgi:vacuolar iron transporter family protein